MNLYFFDLSNTFVKKKIVQCNLKRRMPVGEGSGFNHTQGGQNIENNGSQKLGLSQHTGGGSNLMIQIPNVNNENIMESKEDRTSDENSNLNMVENNARIANALPRVNIRNRSSRRNPSNPALAKYLGPWGNVFPNTSLLSAPDPSRN